MPVNFTLLWHGLPTSKNLAAHCTNPQGIIAQASLRGIVINVV